VEQLEVHQTEPVSLGKESIAPEARIVVGIDQRTVRGRNGFALS
jgi:hypothetical protein